MGIWGIGIYDNDTAEDVRDACKDIFAFYDVEEGNRKIFGIFVELLTQKRIDNDQASFWYALADWQWKHGILTECVKKKTIELLTDYAGIEEWAKDGNKRDVVRRKRTLDLLRTRLQSSQPSIKKPKLHLAKPKHKPGDIIVFRATDYRDEWDSTWKIRNFRPPFIFKSSKLAKSNDRNINGYDVHGKYMAILCVGSEKEPHSEYIPGLFDEYSVYVWYNYLSEVSPSVGQLKVCGFLPMIKWRMKDFYKDITDSLLWIYRFTLPDESFKSSSYVDFENKITGNKSEVNRFNQLFSQKSYVPDYYRGEVLTVMFYTAFEEANRADLLGLKVDDLLDTEIINPELLPPSEIDEACKQRIQEL